MRTMRRHISITRADGEDRQRRAQSRHVLRLQRRNQRIEGAVELPGRLWAELGLDAGIDRIDFWCHARRQGTAARAQGYEDAALIVREALALDQADLLHSREHTCETRARQPAELADLLGLARPEVGKHAQAPPLLLGEAVHVQQRPETADYALSRLQHEQRQVPMFEF